jgi:hypothetical protein
MEHSQAQSFAHNQRHRAARVYPELVRSANQTEREASYYAALKLVAVIDDDLTRGIRHYRTRAGVLLTTLDEVVRAILDNDLLITSEEEDVIWVTPQELAA